ncbi:MAG: hypothetical protein FJZ09_01600 [Candidatus Omnitrophica bacterium]|nr:hypothetical protein [Candidatus Omnitrophota bacterium]
MEETAKKLGISAWSLYGLMQKNNIPRRLHSEAGYLANKNKPAFEIRMDLDYVDERLKIAGCMLYWAEGSFSTNFVDFTNSNPEMIKLFLCFLREICGVKEERLRVYLYAYSAENLEAIKRYWQKITGIPGRQFTKPYIRRPVQNLTKRKLPQGLVHIRYNDKRLLEILKIWIEEYVQWAGTQVAKGGRLSKGSVLSKGRMEK